MEDKLLAMSIEHLITMTEYRIKDYKTIDKRKVGRAIAYYEGKVEAYEEVLSLLGVMRSEQNILK